MNSNLFCLDCDGVILDLVSSFRKLVSDNFGINQEDITKQDFSERFGLSKKQEHDLWEKLEWWNLDGLPGAADAINNVRNYGFRIAVVTGLPESKRSEREHNLLQVLGFVPDIYFTNSGKETKAPVLEELQPMAYADDMKQHILDAESLGIPYLGWITNTPGKFSVPTLKIFLESVLRREA